MSVPLNNILRDPSIQENVIDYFKNSHNDEPILDYDLGINLEEIVGPLLHEEAHIKRERKMITIRKHP